jgi:hypothetical protein
MSVVTTHRIPSDSGGQIGRRERFRAPPGLGDSGPGLGDES